MLSINDVTLFRRMQNEKQKPKTGNNSVKFQNNLLFGFYQIFIFGGIVNDSGSDIVEIFDGKRRVLEPFLDIFGNPITIPSLTSLVSSCSFALVSNLSY